MGVSESPDRFARWPRWLVDGLFGLGVTFVGVVGLSAGWAGVFAVLSPVAIGGPTTGFRFASLAWYLLAMASFVVLYVGWSLGLTVGYRRYRDLRSGPLVERPGPAAVRWLAATGALAVVLVAGATVGSLAGSRGSTGPLRVPVLLVGDPAAPLPTYEGAGGLVTALVAAVVIGAAFGIAVGSLLHGVLQGSLRRTTPQWVAIGLPAVALPVLFGETNDPIALVVLVAYAGVVGYAYHRTRNLLVPMAAYAVLDVVVLAATVTVLT